jgi:hypothetical protein
MPWYTGPALLEYLETVPLPEKTVRDDFRFPVQSVIRPDATFRGFAGRVASGVIRPGDEVLALPNGQKTRVAAVVTYNGELPQAIANMSVTLRLEDEIDLSRGEMLVSTTQPPIVARTFCANVVWLHSDPMEVGKTYLVKHAVRQAKIKATRIMNRVDVNTFVKEPATQLRMNDIAEAEFETSVPLFFDPYAKNRTTGSFILIDALTNATVGAGMITHASNAEDQRDRNAPVRAEERRARNGHDPAVIVTGARSDLADRIDRELFERGFQTVVTHQGEIAPAELLRFVRLAKSGGLVLIYSGDVPEGPARKQIAETIGRQVFVVDEENTQADDEHIIRKVLEFVESLRVAAAPYQI